tara:strand:- start:167 stop:1039 length:873 start_codon:yes stop_codon:yes gene_type:complete
MPKSNMRAPLIKDPATSRAINDLYRHINKLLNSISPDVERYPEEALEGSVRAISDKGENTYRIEGKTRDGWITIPAQKKLNGDKANPGKLRLYNDIVNQSSFDIYSGDTLGIDTKSGKIRAKKDGTEYSSPDSAYAGMILGILMKGEDATIDTYTLTTSLAPISSSIKVEFIAPPSGCVEAMFQVYHNSSSTNRTLTLGLSSTGDSYTTLGTNYEQIHKIPDETDDCTVQHYWVVTGLTPGTKYTWWPSAKTSATTAFLQWGENSPNSVCNLIFKITALPASNSTFAVYD